jgi:hypothetical protein
MLLTHSLVRLARLVDKLSEPKRAKLEELVAEWVEKRETEFGLKQEAKKAEKKLTWALLAIAKEALRQVLDDSEADGDTGSATHSISCWAINLSQLADWCMARV